ncbi:hypothetical protein L1887_09237 [Cichorium endivia]|nr:hypothetical protein L1887_09237 [Cichorium endivia]
MLIASIVDLYDIKPSKMLIASIVDLYVIFLHLNKIQYNLSLNHKKAPPLLHRQHKEGRKSVRLLKCSENNCFFT